MSRRRGRHRRRWWEVALLLAGVAAIDLWIWSNAISTLVQRKEEVTFEQQSQAPVPPPAIVSHGLVGRLTIPRLHLSAMVREGADAGTLGVALGHIPTTSLPGQQGNVGVAGHRDTLFRGLRAIHKDDLVEFETLRGSFTYRVDSTEIVSPRDVQVLKAGRYPELTLVTCYPFYFVGSAPDRFIVKARLVSAPPHPASVKSQAGA